MIDGNLLLDELAAISCSWLAVLFEFVVCKIDQFLVLDAEGVDLELGLVRINLFQFLKIDQLIKEPGVLADPLAEEIDVGRTHHGSLEKQPVCSLRFCV